MAAKLEPKKPAPHRLGPFSLRVVRGPKEGRWYWRITEWKDGKEQTAWSGWATLEEANKEAAQRLLAPEPPLQATRQGEEIRTIRDLCEIYIGERQGEVADRTWINFKDRLKPVAAHMGAIVITRFTLRDLESYARLRRPELAPATLSLEVRFLQAAWNWAVKRELIPDKKFPKIPLDSEPVSERYTPEQEEIIKVLTLLKARGCWRYPVVLLLAETGARLDEIASLRRSDIDRTKLLIRVRGKTKGRTLPITPELLAELRPWLVGDAEGGLFGVARATVRGLNCPSSKPDKPVFNLEEICKQAGVPRFTPHGLRRAFVIRCFQAGLDPKLESSLAGHSIQVALKCYRQVKETERREAVERVSLNSHKLTRTT